MDKASEAEAKAAIDWLQTSEDQKQTEFPDLVSDIVSQPQIRKLREEEPTLNQIHMLDHSVSLPKVLAKAASKGLVWKQLGGGINQARMNLDDETRCEFIYMKPGSQTPVHKHQGTESTLVLDGTFSDELGHYQRSDFIYRTEKDIHQPRSEEGCLCFTVLDRPLTFTKGLARLLNPFFNHQFRRSTAGRGL
jgi:putative transcriptional regulator